MNNEYAITFETKCYENDWKFLLKTNYLDDMINKCHYQFRKKQLIINNVQNPLEVSRYAQKKVDKHIIDTYYIVDDYIDSALKEIDLSKEKLGKGYNYSSAELVGIYLTETPYLLHFASDCIMEKKGDWIQNACQILQNNPNILTANPVWNFKYDEAKKESQYNDSNFFYGYGFSDQCYLIRTNDFKKTIYNYHHQDSERYPVYGGDLFEKRIDSYMRSKQLLRATSKHISYLHINFPKNHIKKYLVRLMIFFNIYNPIKIIYKKLKVK
jgi:hypothetical protein